MAREAFIKRKFSEGSLDIIVKANAIIAEYQNQGFTLTLRQLYYQFVSRDFIRNKQTEYKRLGKIINDARMAGMLDWSAIEDRTRNLKPIADWTSPASIIRAVGEQYREDLWIGQPYRVEVWIEKDALIGVIEGVCDELRVPYFACRGYASQSELYTAGKRLGRWKRQGYNPVVIHLGDHDPSGMDMTRDNEARLSLFAGTPVEVVRVALNMDQIREYDPPPNPAKDSDARFEAYQAEHGDESWELDALEPQVISDLIRTEVEERQHALTWRRAEGREALNRNLLGKTALNWGEVAQYVRDI